MNSAYGGGIAWESSGCVIHPIAIAALLVAGFISSGMCRGIPRLSLSRIVHAGMPGLPVTVMYSPVRDHVYTSTPPSIARDVFRGCVLLTWRRRPHEIIPIKVDGESVRLNEAERVSGLRLDVDAHHIEPGAP